MAASVSGAMRSSLSAGSFQEAGRPVPISRQSLACARAVAARPLRRVVSVSAAAASAPVKITIQGRRLEVTQPIKEYVEEKVSKAVKHYANTVKKVDVTLSARGGDTGTHGAREQKVDVTIFTKRHGVVRVEDAEENLYASIDIVCDKVMRKLNKIKEKGVDVKRTGGSANEAEFKEYMEDLIMDVAAVSYDEEEAFRRAELEKSPVKNVPESVLRSKVLVLEPISVDEAVEAMEAVGHDFYVFREKSSDSVQVVYKRESGGYGILIVQKAP